MHHLLPAEGMEKDPSSRRESREMQNSEIVTGVGVDPACGAKLVPMQEQPPCGPLASEVFVWTQDGGVTGGIGCA